MIEISISEALGYTPGLVCSCGSKKVISWSDVNLTVPPPQKWEYTILCDSCGKKSGPGDYETVVAGWKEKTC